MRLLLLSQKEKNKDVEMGKTWEICRICSTIWTSTLSCTGFSALLADFSSHFAHPHGDYKHLDVSVEDGLAAGHR